jgi:hypothetical protein
MSLDFWLVNKLEGCDEEVEVYGANITHNLSKMARECGLYESLWDSDSKFVSEVKENLIRGINELKKHPEKYEQYNSQNGWGKYENLLFFAECVLHHINKYPKAKIGVWR